MSAIDITKWERHNLVNSNRKLKVRPGLFSHVTSTAGTVFQAGFSVESPSTSEVWHYLVEQSTATGECFMRVVTEDMQPLFRFSLGVCSGDLTWTCALNFGQMIVNSPSMSAPLYGLIGGGLTTAIKQASQNPDTTAIPIPSGYCCAFGDRVAIAQGRTVYFSDPGVTANRTYVAENTWVVDGQILDLLVGGDGSLYAFTTTNVSVLPSDALGKGQQVSGFVSVIPGIYPARSRNAAVSNGVVATLTADGLQIIGGEQRDLSEYEGRRYWSIPIEVDDFRIAAQLFAIPDGFLICFPGRPFVLLVNLRDDSISYVWTKTQQPLSAAGALKGRDGETLIICRDRVVEMMGTLDFDGQEVRGVACGELAMDPNAAGVVRSVTLASDSVSEPTYVFAGGFQTTSTTAIRSAAAGPAAGASPPDDIIGTDLWSASGRMVGRSARTTLHRTAARDGDLMVEVAVDGANRSLGIVDVTVRGQARKRRDKYR